MSIPLRTALATLATTAALVVSPMAGAASASAQVTQLQQRVDTYLATHPGTHQLSENEIAIPGGSLTLAAPGSNVAAPACSSGHLCIVDGTGARYDYYYCGLYNFNGVGDGTFNNNQTSGTVAKFYNSDGTLRWTNTAKDTGTASWTPVYKIRPC